jgi:hypothetical protein
VRGTPLRFDLASYGRFGTPSKFKAGGGVAGPLLGDANESLLVALPRGRTSCEHLRRLSIRNGVLMTTYERNILATAVVYPSVPRKKLKSVLYYILLLFSYSSKLSTLETRRVRSRLDKALI